MAKIGLLATVSYAYENMPADLGQRKLVEAEGAASQLEAATRDEVILSPLVSTVEEATAAGDMFASRDVYAIVILPTIATMAAVPWAALMRHSVPAVVWSRTREDPRPSDPRHAVYDSTPVGAMAIANVLVREDVVFVAANGPTLGDRALDFLRAARVAHSLRHATLGHVGGGVYPGMLDVQLDRDALSRAIGLRIMDLELDSTVPPAPGDQFPKADIEPLAYQQSLKLAGQLEAAVAREGVIGGAINCHGSGIARNEAIGIVGCLAVNRLTERGIPFACTGDDCTAVALTVAVGLADSAQYFEMDAVDPRLDAVLLTSGGEGDLRLADRAYPPRLVANRFFSGVHGRGAAHDFTIRAGEATLLAFTPVGDRFRLIAAEGRVLNAQTPDVGVPRAYFSFDIPACDGFDRWCESGANHHLALAPGRRGAAVRALATILGIDYIAV